MRLGVLGIPTRISEFSASAGSQTTGEVHEGTELSRTGTSALAEEGTRAVMAERSMGSQRRFLGGCVCV